MSDVFIVDFFSFQINKKNNIFCCIESTFYRNATSIKHMIVNTLTYTTKIIYNTLVYFTIYPFSAFKVCV